MQIEIAPATANLTPVETGETIKIEIGNALSPVAVNAAALAQAAQVLSESARDDSQAAQALSETAQGHSETAQGLSEGARDASQTAQGLSEAARNAALQSQTAAAADTAQVALDLVSTNQDTIDTAADKAITNQDKIDVNAAKLAMEILFDNFDDRFLGTKTADPTLDNDGDPLSAGAVYYNSVSKSVRFYNGSVWDGPATAAATSAANALASENAAALSEGNAGTSEANAEISETNAGISEVNAAASAAAVLSLSPFFLTNAEVDARRLTMKDRYASGFLDGKTFDEAWSFPGGRQITAEARTLHLDGHRTELPAKTLTVTQITDSANPSRDDIIYIRGQLVDITSGTAYAGGALHGSAVNWAVVGDATKKAWAVGNNIWSTDAVWWQWQVELLVAEGVVDLAALGYTQDTEDPGMWSDGTYVAVLITPMSTRNAGAYDDLNQNGGYNYSDGLHFYETVQGRTSIADAFTNAGTGASIWGTTDAITEDNLPSAGSNARYVEDDDRKLRQDFLGLADGTFRGWENGSTGTVVDILPASGSANDIQVRQSSIFFAAGYANTPTWYTAGIPAGLFLSFVSADGTTVSGTTTGVYTTADGVFLRFRSGNVTDTYSPVGLSAASITTAESVLPPAKTLFWCDIIGNPANYPAAWLTGKLPGNPLLVGENGEDYVPDGTGKTFKFSRKVLGVALLLTLWSDDNGTTWGTDTTVVGAASNVWNDGSVGQPTGRISLHYYTTAASPFEDAANAEVLVEGKVWAGNSAYAHYGNELLPNLIGKVGVSISKPYSRTYQPPTYTINSNDGTFLSTVGWEPTHGPINLAGTGPAVKALPYLSDVDGKAVTHVIGKEMIYDSGKDSHSEATGIDPTVGQSYTAGVIYKFTAGKWDGHLFRCKVTTSLTPLDTILFETQEGLVGSTGAVYFTLWDGTGWGDDGTFNSVDNTSTSVDLNGNTGVVCTKRVKLPLCNSFIR